MRLGNIASVRSGLVLSRKQAKGDTVVRYPVLNLRCIKPDGSIEYSQLDRFYAAEYLMPEYLTHTGDIVIRLTAPYTAVLIDKTMEGIVISSSFAVVRTDSRVLMPEYLFWILNTNESRREIYDNATGSMIGAIKPRYFADFEIRLLPIAKQRQIAELNALARKEIQLLVQLAEKKRNYYDKILEKIHNEEKRG